MLFTTVFATDPSNKLSSAKVDVIPSSAEFISVAVAVINVSLPDVPRYNAPVRNSEVDLLASTISAELAVVVP